MGLNTLFIFDIGTLPAVTWNDKYNSIYQIKHQRFAL